VKKLITGILFIVLTSCGSSLERPKSNIDYENIKGKPIKIGNIEVAQYDFPERMNWEDSKAACEKLGQGWRLPSIDELDFVYTNRVVIGEFAIIPIYWSSTDYRNPKYAWRQNFKNGLKSPYSKNKYKKLNVRAVRNF
jgi:hypothetical protein